MSDKWQPIETAPKDGSPILTYPNYVITFWEDDISEIREGKAGFVVWSDYYDTQVIAKGRTHWMPLPKPPQSPNQ